MRTRSIGLTLLAGLAIVSAACSGSASPSPSASAGSPGSALKIGVVTDVGTLDDKNFNEFSFDGAKRGATAIGAAEPKPIITQNSADYEKNINSFIADKFDIIVTIGFALGDSTAIAAKANPTISFIGVDQGVCVDAAGAPDPTFTCAGDAAALLPNYQGLVFAETQPGYLAGIVAASVSKTKIIGAIGGSKTIPPVVNYIIGYYNGAKSVDPAIEVKIAYVSDDLGKAFNDPAGGKQFAQQFIQANKPDVLFQVAGKTGNGVLDAACEAKIEAIGVDVDQHLSYPAATACILTSAEKKLSNAVMLAIQKVADKTAKGGTVVNNAANDGIGLSPFYDMESSISAETKTKLDAALAGLKDGSIKSDTPIPGQ